MEQRQQLTDRLSLEQEMDTLFIELEQVLREILAANPKNDAVRARLTYLLACADHVRQKFAPRWRYLKEPPDLLPGVSPRK
jgi:hypothetical protein